MIGRRFALVPLLLAAWFGFATDASAADSVEANDVAPIEGDVTPLNQCLVDNKSLSVLFLVDTSQSLKRTDPEAARVAGLQSAVSSLATLQSARTNDPVDVRVEFASFGTTTQRTFPGRPLWAPLDVDEALINQLDVGYRTNNESEDTDYVGALEPWANREDPARADQVGAIELLEQAPANSCRLLVWFTDGRFDIDYQDGTKTLHWATPPIEITSEADATAAEGLGVDLLCRPQGLADHLHAPDIANGSGVEVAVVALGEESNYDLLRSVALGQQSGDVCGELPARGLFLGASDVSSLVLQLRSAVLGPDKGSATGSLGIATCDSTSGSTAAPQDQVADFEYPFQLSQGLTAFNLLALPGSRSVQSVLVSPDGAEYPLSESTTLPNGVGLSVKPLALTSGGYQVEGTLPPETASWTGQWRVRFCTDDPAAVEAINRASIYVFGGLEAQLRDGPAVEIRKGSEGSFVVELVSAAGLPATDVAVAADSVLEVSVDGQVLATPEPGGDGSFTYTYPVAEDTAVDEVAITATLTPVLHLAADAPTLTLAQWSGELGTITLAPYPVEDVDRSFELGGELVGFNVLALPADAGIETLLVSPDGSEYPLAVGESTTLDNGVTLSVDALVDRDGFQVNGVLPEGRADEWAGTWLVRFRSDASVEAAVVDDSAMYLFGGVQPQLRDGPAVEIRKGSEGSFVVELVSAAGLPATDVAVAADSVLEVSVDGQVLATPEPGGDGSFTYTYPVAEDTAVDEVAITATLTPVLHLADDAPTLTLAQWSGELGTITLAPYPVEDVDRSFELGGELVGFNVLALPADAGIETLLVSPDGSEYPLAVGESTTLDNGVTLSVDALVDRDGFQVNGVLPEGRADEWAGTWLVRFRSDASVEAAVVDDSAMYLFGGVQPQLRDGPAVEIRKGSEGSFVVELVSAAGLPATDVAVAADSVLEVSVDGQVLATPEPGGDGSFTYTYPVAEDTAVDEVAITATLTPVLHLADDAPTLTLAQWSGELGTITLAPYPVEDVDRSFELGGELVGFNVLALPADAGIETLLVSPDGSEYPLAVGESTTLDNGVTLSVDALVDRDGFQVNGVLPEGRADEWAGTWLVRFRSDASVEAAVVDDSAMYLFGGVQPQLRDGPAVEIRKGSEGSFVVELVSAAGLPATDVAVAADSVLEVSVDGQVLATPEPGGDGSFTYTYPVAEDTAVDEVAITATLTPVLHLADDAPTLTLAQWSGELGTITLAPVPQFPLVETPAEFESAVDQEHLVLETTIGVDATATASGGCVTLTKLVAPAGAATDHTLELSVFDGERQVEVDDECAVQVADGERRELRVRLDASDLTIETPETFEGSLSFRSVSEIDPTKSDTFDDLTVPVRVNPIYVTHTEWLKVAGLVALAVLLPLLLLIGANLYRARVDVGRVALVELPVLFTGGRLLRRTPDGATGELAFDDEDMRTARVPPAGRYRSVTTGSATFTGRVRLNPFADVYADVTVVDAAFVVGAAGSTRDGHRGLLDGSLTPSSMDAWAFASSQRPVVDGDATAPIEGSLILLTHTIPEAATAALADIVPSIEDSIGRSARRHAVADEQATADSDGQSEHLEASEPPASVNPLADDDPRSSADPFDVGIAPVLSQGNEEPQRKPRGRLFGRKRQGSQTPSPSSAELPTPPSVPLDAEEHGPPAYQGPPL